MTALPSWAPETLASLHQARLEEGGSYKDDALLERFLTDSRMENVWRAIEKRTNPQDEFPLLLFISLATLFSWEEPKEPPELLKRRYNRIATLAKELGAAMENSILEREGMSRWIAIIKKSAEEKVSSVDHSFLPYTRFMDRFDMESPVKTLLARSLYQRFISAFGQPLWDSIATLIEVALDLPPETITVDFVRATCENVGVVKPSESS